MRVKSNFTNPRASNDAPEKIRVVISPPRLFTTPHRNMGNGWVQRTRRSTVERVIERVHTDVNEMVPVHHGGMNGGAGSGHLGGGAGNHGAGSNGWLNGELARQVHNKFEDMVRQSPAPTRAERSAYDELVRSFPTPESRGRLMLGDGSADARDAGIVSPPTAPWMNGPGSGSDRYPSRLANGGGGDRTADDASGSPNERSLFSDLKSPPPSMRKASGGSGAGFTLDDLILRKKGPDAAKGGASRGAIFSPQPSPPRRGGRGGNARGRKPAAAKKPPTPEPSESSSESDEPSEDADGDYVSPGGGDRSPLEKLAHAAEKRASARDVGGGGSPGLRSPSGKKKKSPAARKSHRIGDSDSDDDGNKISAVRAGKTTKGSKGSGGAKRGSREAQQLLIAAQRMARVSANKAAKEATTPAAPAVTAVRSGADTPAGSTGGGRSGGRSTRERRAPSAFWLNEDAKRKDPFAKTPTSAAEPKSPKKPAAKAKPGPKPKSSAKSKAKEKAKPKSKPVAKRRRDDDDSSESSSSDSSEDGSESESESEEETLEARVARNASAVKRSLEKRMKGRSPKKGPAARARPAKKNAAKPIVYSESEDDDESEEDDEDDEEEEDDEDVPPPKGDDDTEESDGDDDDDTEESDEDSDDDTPLASRYKSKPSKAAAASPKGGKKPAPKPSPKKPNRRHSAEHAAALVSAEIMGRKTSIAKRFGLNVARVVDSEAESSDEEVESSDDEESPGSTPTDASSDRTDASSPETATDGNGDTTGDDDATPATKGSKPAAEGTTPGSSGRSIEKGKRGGWRPGAGRPRKPDDPNDPTPRKRRRLPGEPPRKRGRPRKIPTLEDIEAGHIRRKPASAEEKAAALRMLGGGSIFGNDDGADPKARGRPRKDAKSQEPQQKRQPVMKAKAPVKDAAPVKVDGISSERWAARVSKVSKTKKAGVAEEASPESPARKRKVSFGDDDVRAIAKSPRSTSPKKPAVRAPPPSRYGSDRTNEQVSAAKSSRRKSILRTLGKSLGEENDAEVTRNSTQRRYSDVPEFEVFGFQGTPVKGGASPGGGARAIAGSPDFGGSPGLFTAKSPGGLISQLDTDTPVTSPVRSSPRLRI